MPITNDQWKYYKSIDREGELIETHTASRWDDLKVPAASINPPGAASDPDRDATDGTWLFDGGSTEVLFFQVQIPHSWEIGTPLSPHIHWVKTTSAAGTVKWRMNYRVAPIGQVFSAWSADDDATLVVDDNDTAESHALSAFTDIAWAGTGVSTMFLIKLSRIGGDDTYAADAKMLEFDIHIKSDFPGGSISEYSK